MVTVAVCDDSQFMRNEVSRTFFREIEEIEEIYTELMNQEKELYPKLIEQIKNVTFVSD